MVNLNLNSNSSNSSKSKKIKDKRSVVSVSLPRELNNEIDEIVKKEKFVSKSEFFRYLIRNWKESRLIDK